MGWGGVGSIGVGSKVEKNFVGVCFWLFGSLLLKFGFLNVVG